MPLLSSPELRPSPVISTRSPRGPVVPRPCGFFPELSQPGAFFPARQPSSPLIISTEAGLGAPQWYSDPAAVGDLLFVCFYASSLENLGTSVHIQQSCLPNLVSRLPPHRALLILFLSSVFDILPCSFGFLYWSRGSLPLFLWIHSLYFLVVRITPSS